jgi:AraC-like DNA-binding protein
MDPISDMFRTLNITALVHARMEATAPWGVAAPVQTGQTTHTLTHQPGVAFFCMVSRGHCWLSVDGEKEPLSLTGGDCFLLAPQVAFTLSDELRTVPVSFCALADKAVENVIQYGGGGTPTTLISGLLQFNQCSIRPIETFLPRLILIRAEHSQSVWLHTTLQMLASEMTQQVPGSDVAANRLAEVLFVQTIRSYVTSGLNQSKSGWLRAIFDPQIGAALKAIHANISMAWTVESLADTAGMSRSSFACRFKELLGKTPIEYVTEWRMQKSLGLLMRGEKKMTDIAQQVGYETDAAFNRAFKRTVGATPGQYRERYSQN